MKTTYLTKIATFFLLLLCVFVSSSCNHLDKSNTIVIDQNMNAGLFDPDNILNENYLLGIQHMKEGDDSTAEFYLRKAFKESSNTHGVESPETAYIEMELGRLLVIEGKYSEAMDYLVSSYVSFKDIFGINNTYTMLALCFLSECDIFLGNYEEAMASLLDIYSELKDIESKGLLASYISHNYTVIGDYAEACNWYDTIWTNLINGDYDDSFYRQLYNGYGIYLAAIGNYEEAISAYQQALNTLATDEKGLPNTLDADCIEIYINLAIACHNNNNTELAVETMNKVELGALYNRNNPILYALYLETIADAYYDLDDYNAAKKKLDDALEILLDSVGENHSLVSNAYNLLSVYYSYCGEYQNAIFCQEKAVEIRKNLLEQESISTANILDNLSNNYYEIGDYKKSLESAVDAASIISNILGENSIEFSTPLILEAWAYSGLNEYENAYMCADSAIQICKEMIGGNQKQKETCAYVYLGAAIICSKNYSNALEKEHAESVPYKKSLKYFSTAEKLYSSLYGAESVNVAIVYLYYGDAYAFAGDYQKADDYYRSAYRVYLNNNQSKDDMIEAFSGRLGNLHEITAPQEDAGVWFEKWLQSLSVLP